MSIYEAHQTDDRRLRTPRLWLVETLVVLGVLAFGYFAVTVDSSPWIGDSVQAETADPLLSLVR